MNRVLLGFGLAGCAVPDEPEDCPGATIPPGAGLSRAIETFPAPWDPVKAVVVPRNERLEVLGPPIPVFHDGEIWPLEPLLNPPYVTERSSLYQFPREPIQARMSLAGAWVVPPELEFGVDGSTCTAPTLPEWTSMSGQWKVGDYGRADEFHPDSVVGEWALSEELLLAAGDDRVGDLVSPYLWLSLEILAVSDGEAEFRVISHRDGECVLLHDVGALSSTGEFTWSDERLEAATEPAPLVLYAPRMRLGFNGTDLAAGGEVSVIVDVRASEGGEMDVCALAAGMDIACEPCADDGHPSCLPLAGYGWRAELSSAAYGEELPLCGFDFSDTGVVPDFDCGWDGTLCAFASFISVAPLLRKRRRDER